MIAGIHGRRTIEMRRIMQRRTVLLILVATSRKSDIRVRQQKNTTDCAPDHRIIAIRLVALNRTELILTCNINRVLCPRGVIISLFARTLCMPTRSFNTIDVVSSVKNAYVIRGKTTNGKNRYERRTNFSYVNKSQDVARFQKILLTKLNRWLEPVV